MRRFLFIIVVVGVISFAGCGFKVFENVEADPHPPTIFNLKVEPTTLSPGGSIVIVVGYADAGADIDSFHLNDRDGAESWEMVPAAPVEETDDAGDTTTTTKTPAPEYFPGTSGVVAGSVTVTAKQKGTHRLEIWAEDSRESRSDKIQFEITIDY